MDIDVENRTWNIYLKKKPALDAKLDSRNNTLFSHLWFPNCLLLFITRNYENSACTFSTILRIVIVFIYFLLPAPSKISLVLTCLMVWQTGSLAIKQPKFMLSQLVSVRYFEGSYTRIILKKIQDPHNFYMFISEY